MKFKEYKIRVPEGADYQRRVSSDKFEWIRQWLERHQIHELVQTHSFNLGWNWRHSSGVSHTEKEYLYFEDYGRILHGTLEEGFDDEPHTEIHWQEFLKLTRDDVVIYESQTELTESFPIKKGEIVSIGSEKFRIGDIYPYNSEWKCSELPSYGSSDNYIPYFSQSVNISEDFIRIGVPRKESWLMKVFEQQNGIRCSIGFISTTGVFLRHKRRIPLSMEDK